MLKEFKEFAMKGNMLDMAVGIVIGAAFSAIVSSMVDDIIMPPIGLILGNIDFSEIFIILKQGTPEGPYATVAAAKEAGAVTWNVGLFINALIKFVIVRLLLSSCWSRASITFAVRKKKLPRHPRLPRRISYCCRKSGTC